MRVPSSLLVLAASLSTSFVAAAPSECAPKLKETVQPPRGWVKSAPAPSDHIIELRIGLQQPNFHILEQHLYEVSDPLHERYGAHLSKEEVEELVAPHADSLGTVDEWLSSHGIEHSDIVLWSPAKDWVTIRVPVSRAEKMLDTKYHVWIHSASGDSLVRTTSYSLPENVHAHIDVIQPTTMFKRKTKEHRTTFLRSPYQQQSQTQASSATINTASGLAVNASCNSTITLSCLRELYNAVGYTPSATNGNALGVTGYLEQYANFEDFALFNADQGLPNSTFNVVAINGGLNNQTLSEAGIEADLDTQYAFGLTHPTPATFWTTGGAPPFIPDALEPTDTNEPYTEWLDYILAQPNPPITISSSYGDDEQTGTQFPETYARRVCADFAQLGARGVSLTFSSGDGGVGDGDPDPATQECFTNDGRNVTAFVPGFPASCPYVTAVGGTVYVPEIAVNFSGGGFSNYFARPAYQETAVTGFLNQLPSGVYEGLYNRSGRGIPDVSAQAWNFRIFNAGEAILIGGTSASSPTFTGIVSLLNDARLSQGLPPLGFLNPLLYSTGLSGLNDITFGNNPGCGTEGFNATIGWDAVTGLGTPDFGKLKEIVLA